MMHFIHKTLTKFFFGWSSGDTQDDAFQPVYHTVNTSPTRWIRTASVIIPHRLNNIYSQDFNNYPFKLYLLYLNNFIRN